MARTPDQIRDQKSLDSLRVATQMRIAQPVGAKTIEDGGGLTDGLEAFGRAIPRAKVRRWQEIDPETGHLMNCLEIVIEGESSSPSKS